MDLESMPVGRPEVITDGSIWWEPIENIVGTMSSVDGAQPQSLYDHLPWEEQRWVDPWITLLSKKRKDRQYPAVYASIQAYGWVRPLTVQWDDYDSDIIFGDGHHRLAAAIELGYTHVPVELTGNSWFDCVSLDSGCWDTGDEIPTTNRSGGRLIPS